MSKPLVSALRTHCFSLFQEHMILCRFADQTAVQLPPERRLIGTVYSPSHNKHAHQIKDDSWLYLLWVVAEGFLFTFVVGRCFTTKCLKLIWHKQVCFLRFLSDAVNQTHSFGQDFGKGRKMFTQGLLQCDNTAALNSCYIGVFQLRGKLFVGLKPPGLCCSFTVQCFIMSKTCGLDSSPAYQSFTLNPKQLPNASSGWCPFIRTWLYLSQRLLLCIS